MYASANKKTIFIRNLSKNEIELQKKSNRVTGGLAYNIRIDAICSGLLKFSQYNILDLNGFLKYLKMASPDLFKSWKVPDVYAFLSDKQTRNGDKFEFEGQEEFFSSLRAEGKTGPAQVFDVPVKDVDILTSEGTQEVSVSPEEPLVDSAVDHVGRTGRSNKGKKAK